MILSKPEAVIFDWDNTLVNSWPLLHRCLQETLCEFGKEPWSLEETKLKIHRSGKDSFPLMFGEEWKKAADHYRAAYKLHHIEALIALPDVVPVLEMLSTKGVYLGVVSNKLGSFLREEVQELKWNHFFGKVIGSSDVEEDKPHPAPVIEALKDSGVSDAAPMWFIGDSVSDMECAYRTKSSPILFGHDEADERFDHCKPIVTMPDHKALLKLIHTVF